MNQMLEKLWKSWEPTRWWAKNTFGRKEKSAMSNIRSLLAFSKIYTDSMMVSLPERTPTTSLMVHISPKNPSHQTQRRGSSEMRQEVTTSTCPEPSKIKQEMPQEPVPKNLRLPLKEDLLLILSKMKASHNRELPKKIELWFLLDLRKSPFLQRSSFLETCHQDQELKVIRCQPWIWVLMSLSLSWIMERKRDSCSHQ